MEAQRKIDYDLNLALAKAAKESGIKVCVLISSSGTSASSRIPYSKMKGQLEEAVKELGFPYTVILRPGLLVGERTESRPMEAVIRGIAKGLGAISTGLTDFWAQGRLFPSPLFPFGAILWLLQYSLGVSAP